jgi:hypothetical protein
MKIIFIIVLILIFIYINFDNHVKHFIITKFFSDVAPSNKNDKKNKKLSDDIYFIKKKLEKKIKLDVNKECTLNMVSTYFYKDIKSQFDKEYFRKISDDYTKPVLIKEVFNDHTLDKFSIENLIKNYGDIIVEALSLEDEKNIDGIKLPLKDYLNKIKNGEKYYLTVNNSLANGIDIISLMKFYDIIFDDYGIKNIFLGNKHSSTHLHSELAGSCAIQLNGIKKWYLINPKYSHNLHPIPDKNNIFFVSSIGFLKRNKKTNLIPPYEIIAEKGDFLFVPPWWWHETLNLTDDNFMFSYRPTLFEAPLKTNLNNTLNSFPIPIGYNKFILPIIKKLKIINLDKDTVIQSLKEINLRLPELK